MQDKNLKYKFIANLLSIVYLNFFFMSPFFHHHPDEGLLNNGNSEIHSHLVDDILNESEHSESDHHLEDGNEHSHFFKPNYVNVIAPGRHLLDFAVILVSDCIIADLSTDEETQTQLLVISSLTSKALWEKYVQTASNTSPPKA